MVEEHFFDDRDELIQTLAARCEAQLLHAIDQRGKASLLVSGGSTPAPLYRELSHRMLDWSRVGVGLVDERWVNADHSASNERFIREHLLFNKARDAAFYPMKQNGSSAQAAAADVAELYQSKLSWPADLVILGMGADGHTASLFPRAEGLEQGLNPDNPSVCCAINAIRSPVTGEYTERLSLTYATLCRAKELVLLITGSEKLAVYQAAKTWQNTIDDCPIAALLTDAKVTVSVFWAP